MFIENDAYLYYNLGNTYKFLENYKKAIEYYKLASHQLKIFEKIHRN